MKKIRVKTPAKINYTLEILNKRDDGFHNIQSIMQAISLYDYLTIEVKETKGLKIELSGNSQEIPYDERNLVYKAAVKFFEKTKLSNGLLKIYIEKNIPISAGLAGGSSNAAGVIYALNVIFNMPLDDNEINVLCSELGSDLNFCLKGGCSLCTSRGEIIEQLPAYIQNISLIKPKNLGISAKEAYTKFSILSDKSNPNNTLKLKDLLEKNKFDNSLLYNSLEKALFPYYKELEEVKNNVKNSLMTGSGSTFFVCDKDIKTILNPKKYLIIENLETIDNGVILD